MPNSEDIRWFKEQFHSDIEAGVAGTPFDLDMMTALACQETGEIWPVLRKDSKLNVSQILALCVGDTLDADKGRKAFPQTKSALIKAVNGKAMFDIARQALVDMAAHIKSYKAAAKNPNKFAHGYGLWQYDLQFFLVDPDYFLQKRYQILGQTMEKALHELRQALKKVGFQNKSSLTDMEMAVVAIAYNTGGFKPKLGLRQGFKSSDGRFYGELIFDFIRLSKTVPIPGGRPAIAAPATGAAIVPPPTRISSTGDAFVVHTTDSPLRLRSSPEISTPIGKNVIAQLPEGQTVIAVTGKKFNGFIEIETSLSGAHLRGFASARFLNPAPSGTVVPVIAPEASPTLAGISAVTMPRRPGTVTKRTEPADAHSLNEPNQPGRQGSAPAELVIELGKIIDWLAVDKPAHKRYQPHDGLTFCNIYAHDYCTLASVYLPRVWWTQRAIIDLTQGMTVEPLIGNTIVEMRANSLFRWLRDFGPMFGWRQTGTLTKLQQNANQGGISLIVARRKEDGRSGHMVMVVPESDEQGARRNNAGEVIAPVQSQAGARNFRRGTGSLNWWTDDRFAESAFWIHP